MTHTDPSEVCFHFLSPWESLTGCKVPLLPCPIPELWTSIARSWPQAEEGWGPDPDNAKSDYRGYHMRQWRSYPESSSPFRLGPGT